MKPRSLSPQRADQRGLSLVELMIALVLGLFLIGGILSVLLANQQGYRLQEAMSKLQEESRYVLHKLTAELRRAGYSGCYGDLSVGVENLLASPTDVRWSLANTLQGFNNVSSTDTIGGITGFVAGSDALLIKGMSDGVPLAGNPNTNSFTIAAADNRFAAGEILLVTDCEEAALFQASSVATSSGVTTILHAAGGGRTPGNSTGAVTTRFGTDAEIGRLDTALYYLRNQSNGRPALYRANLEVTGGTTVTFPGEELIDGVEDLQLSFGVDTDGDLDADQYRDGGAITNWGQVVSVRIALLLASQEDNLATDNNSYTFSAGSHTFTRDSTHATGADRRLRRVLTGFGALRNRTF